MTATPTKNCEVCGNEFFKPVTCSNKRWDLRSFCSKHCANSRSSTDEGIKVDGIIHGTISSYNDHECRCFECRTAAKGYRQRSRAGILISKEERAPTSQQEVSHSQWKGDDVGYPGVHAWVRRHKVKTGLCEHCGENKGLGGQSTHWANVDHKYQRNLDDYIELCCSCHKKYDLEHNLGKRAA